MASAASAIMSGRTMSECVHGRCAMSAKPGEVGPPQPVRCEALGLVLVGDEDQRVAAEPAVLVPGLIVTLLWNTRQQRQLVVGEAAQHLAQFGADVLRQFRDGRAAVLGRFGRQHVGGAGFGRVGVHDDQGHLLPAASSRAATSCGGVPPKEKPTTW